MPRKEHGWGTRKGEVELAGKWNCRAGKRKKQENARVCAVVLQFQRLIHTNAHLWKERERERERERESWGREGCNFVCVKYTRGAARA